MQCSYSGINQGVVIVHVSIYYLTVADALNVHKNSFEFDIGNYLICTSFTWPKKKKKKFAVGVWMIPFRSVRPLHLGLVLDFKCLLLLPLDIDKVSRVVSTHFLKWSILKQPLKRPSCGTVAVLLP